MKAFFGSMTGRVFGTLVLGTVVTMMVTQIMAEEERQRVYVAYRESYVLERSEELILAAETVPASARAEYMQIANRTSPGVKLLANTAALPLAPLESEFARALAARIEKHSGHRYKFDSIAVKPAACALPRIRSGMFGDFESSWPGVCESVNIHLRSGDILRLDILPPGDALKSGYLRALLIFLISIAVLAFFVSRMITRPLKQLAQAATDLGLDINHPPLKLTGASEIRQASAAFNAMQARIRQYIFQRTQMLAAITHDLQTPLTRLRLRLEKVGDAELQERLVGDLSAMQVMVREGLDLARSMDANETMQALDLDSLLGSVCCDATDAGQEVDIKGRASMAMMGRPMALRRCLVNLIDNAVKYGQRALVAVENTGAAARIRIRDNGPGIGPTDMGRVFEPFYRVESSRSRESGGTGLGLTIARNIAEQHGGTIALANHPDGGLEVTLTLPKYSGK